MNQFAADDFFVRLPAVLHEGNLVEGIVQFFCLFGRASINDERGLLRILDGCVSSLVCFLDKFDSHNSLLYVS